MISVSEYNEKDDMALYLFHQGTNFLSYKYLGVHKGAENADGKFFYTFRVWAPNADAVCVTGDFCQWNEGISMHRHLDSGVWEITLRSDESLEGTFYKYAIRRNGRLFLKADPYALSQETMQNTASVIRTGVSYAWGDSEWMAERKKQNRQAQRRKNKHYFPMPMNIYEMHLGSWHTMGDVCTADGTQYLGYREIADRLLPYLREMGYTHVELMPVMEHPYDGSWGYQICGYFAPTARYGSPEDFMYFVDTMHKGGIGVILDWVPAHFPKDAHGLYEFDGGPLYEYQGADRMEHKGWGTRCFDVGRTEVQSFLVSNALFWLREYHADGLRVDAVASMLYLDYDRTPGEWMPNVNGTNHNLEAIAFFQKLNTAVFGEFEDILMIAEESTAWPMITRPVYDGGLGFNFKWNMGFANDLFEYVSADPIYRRWMHTKLTFPLMYAFEENYILPVSHDEVVHGKKSLVDKMFGTYDEKFATMRAFLMYMMSLPGKKLTFMGTEFAQFREWDYQNSLEWFLLEYPNHAQMQTFVRDLNHFYLDNRPFWEIDDGWDGFAWIDADNAEEGILSYRRIDTAKREILCIINFVPVKRENFLLPVPKAGTYEEILTSDAECYGGGGTKNGTVKTESIKEENVQAIHRIRITLPPLSGIFLKKVMPKRTSSQETLETSDDNTNSVR